MLKALREFIIRLFLKDSPKGVMTTLPNKDLVDMNVQMLAEKLMRNGIDPNSLKNANQVENAINMIENRSNVQQGIKSTQTAKVFDMEGKEIPKGSKIMGGKAIDDDLPPPGSRGGPDDIAAPVMNVEDAPEGFIDFVRKTDPKGAAKLQKEQDRIRAKIEAANKRAVENIRRKKEEGTYKRFQPSPELDRQIKEEYKKAVKGESKQFPGKFKGTEEEFRDMLDDMTQDFAQGGRAGFATGGVTNLAIRLARGFMKVTGKKPNNEEIVKIIREAAEKDFARTVRDVEIDTPLKGVSETKATIRRMDSVDKDELKKAIDEYNFAQGGIARLGFKDGMTRRTFLKILGGAMSIPIIGKFLKPMKVGKTVTKVPMIKTDDVAGKPEWFDQLVNKVILEGDDVTKRFATKDREIVHMKKLDEDTTVRVTEDMDEGAIRVEYESPENVYGDPVQMQYKKPKPDEGDPRPSAEFDTAESGPVGRAFGPDDYEIEIDEIGGTSISDLTSDVSKLKEYATGKKQTLKEFVQSKKRKDKAKAISEGGESEMDEVVRRQGEFIQFDDVYPEQDFASGGIARMLGE